ncbi:MAG: hypothetical protein WDK96_01215 [Candidatus Paceibacterota bacterium]
MPHILPAEYARQSPLIEFNLFNLWIFDAGSPISRFWDLLVIIPFCLLIFVLSDKDDGFNPGIIVVAAISVLCFLCSFASIDTGVFYGYLVVTGFTMLMACQDLPYDGSSKVKAIINRAIVSLFGIFLCTTIIWGIPNAVIVVTFCLIVYTAIFMISALGYNLFKFIVKVPAGWKSFWAWMDKA